MPSTHIKDPLEGRFFEENEIEVIKWIEGELKEWKFNWC